MSSPGDTVSVHSVLDPPRLLDREPDARDVTDPFIDDPYSFKYIRPGESDTPPYSMVTIFNLLGPGDTATLGDLREWTEEDNARALIDPMQEGEAPRYRVKFMTQEQGGNYLSDRINFVEQSVRAYDEYEGNMPYYLQEALEEALDELEPQLNDPAFDPNTNETIQTIRRLLPYFENGNGGYNVPYREYNPPKETGAETQLGRLNYIRNQFLGIPIGDRLTENIDTPITEGMFANTDDPFALAEVTYEFSFENEEEETITFSPFTDRQRISLFEALRRTLLFPEDLPEFTSAGGRFEVDSFIPQIDSTLDENQAQMAALEVLRLEAQDMDVIPDANLDRINERIYEYAEREAQRQHTILSTLVNEGYPNSGEAFLRRDFELFFRTYSVDRAMAAADLQLSDPQREIYERRFDESADNNFEAFFSGDRIQYLTRTKTLLAARQFLEYHHKAVRAHMQLHTDQYDTPKPISRWVFDENDELSLGATRLEMEAAFGSTHTSIDRLRDGYDYDGSILRNELRDVRQELDIERFGSAARWVDERHTQAARYEPSFPYSDTIYTFYGGFSTIDSSPRFEDDDIRETSLTYERVVNAVMSIPRAWQVRNDHDPAADPENRLDPDAPRPQQ